MLSYKNQFYGVLRTLQAMSPKGCYYCLVTGQNITEKMQIDFIRRNQDDLIFLGELYKFIKQTEPDWEP